MARKYYKQYNPIATNLVRPLFGKELGDELRKHDIYVTASRWEPCGMHHIEGAASGLPVLYHEDSGGIVELCKNHGESFHNFDSFMKSLEKIDKNYQQYLEKIDHASLSIEKCCNSFYNVIEDMTQ